MLFPNKIRVQNYHMLTIIQTILRVRHNRVFYPHVNSHHLYKESTTIKKKVHTLILVENKCIMSHNDYFDRHHQSKTYQYYWLTKFSHASKKDSL